MPVVTNEQRAEMIAERMLGRPILDDRGAGSAEPWLANYRLCSLCATAANDDVINNKEAA